MSVAAEDSISFLSLVPKENKQAYVRCVMIGGNQFLSIRDIIMVMCDKNQNRAAEVWARLPEHYKEEVTAFCGNHQFKGTGQKVQPVIQFQGALKLLMWLPGEQAKILRGQASDILTRYFAGDSSLHAEVEANAESGAAINEAARAALPQVVVAGESNKRRKTVATLEKELAVLTVVTANIREQNLSLREQIELKRELFGMELSYERDRLSVAGQMKAQELEHESAKLEHERAKFALLDGDRKSDIEYKRALKAIENGPAEAASLPPSAYTTVLKVYTKHQAEFSCVPPKARVGLVRMAGKKAADAYRGTNGLHPPTTLENDLEVKMYPVECEAMIVESLRAASREVLAGGNQQQIDGMLIKACKGQDTVVKINVTCE